MGRNCEGAHWKVGSLNKTCEIYLCYSCLYRDTQSSLKPITADLISAYSKATTVLKE